MSTVILVCTGKLSKYTDVECNRRRDQLGCFYKPGIVAFSSCSGICNNVTVGSQQEEKCTQLCSNYKSTCCNITSQPSSVHPKFIHSHQKVSSTSSTTMSHPTTVLKLEPVERLATESDQAVLQLLIVSTIITLSMSVSILVGCIICYVKRTFNTRTTSIMPVCCSKLCSDAINNREGIVYSLKPDEEVQSSNSSHQEEEVSLTSTHSLAELPSNVNNADPEDSSLYVSDTAGDPT
ncbi:uncharacterized protein [Watersipora subatra]|uniref:uncharacterized protein n=1 Tax=Watersipora subatra TaxID=2589382 RepID=UPI00355B295C